MKFARWVFYIAGGLGLLIVGAMFFSEQHVNRTQPPAITHPEYFYGFAGVVLAWQMAFLIIGSDPQRFRPLMPAAMVEKFSFVIAIGVLYAMSRVHPIMVGAASIDLILGVLFVIAYLRTK
jgi:hypothetical protein